MSARSLSRAMNVGSVLTPIEGAFVVAPDTPRRSAIRDLERFNFDQAPVVVDENDAPVGYVLRRDLEHGRGSVGSAMRPILPDAIAGADSPLENALPWLLRSGFLFVLSGQSISGFVVPSDLNKQAGRSYFYLGLVELELRLAAFVRELPSDIDPLTCLWPSASQAIRRRLKTRTQANVEADVVAEMNLSHLFEVAGRHSNLPDAFGAEDWRSVWEPVNRLRRRVAHATRPVLDAQDELAELIHADRTVHRLIRELAAAPGDVSA